MTIEFYGHPFSSYCMKALIALYENDIAFTPVIIDFGDPASRDAFLALWPMVKMPVLRDDGRGETRHLSRLRDDIEPSVEIARDGFHVVGHIRFFFQRRARRRRGFRAWRASVDIAAIQSKKNHQRNR